MKKQLASVAVLLAVLLALLLALLLVVCFHAFAKTENKEQVVSVPSSSGYLFTGNQAPVYQDYTDVITPISAGDMASTLWVYPDIIVNGEHIGHHTARTTVDGIMYVAVSSILRALFPTIDIYFDGEYLFATAPGLTLDASAGLCYFTINGRYLYAPATVMAQDGDLLLPLSTLADALGCSVVTHADTQDVVIRQVGPLITPGTYNGDDLYWLSRIIFAEAGNQPMKGRIAVGTVILNRVVSDRFPNTVEEVIFEPKQFSPVSNGSIYRDPDEESKVAAMLCLDGVREAGDSLYFNVTRLNSWANKNRSYVCTIGGHKFYV